MMRRATVLLAGLVVLGACASGDGERSGATTVRMATTTTTSTVAPSTTTTTEPRPTTTVPRTTTTAQPRYEGIVFKDTPGSEPAFAADGVTARVDAAIVVETGDPEPERGAGIVDSCVQEVDTFLELNPAVTARPSSCLVIQWSFDVDPGFRVDQDSPEAGLSPGKYLGADGIEVDQAIIETGLPGSQQNIIFAAYPLTAGLGGTLRFMTGSNLVGYTTHSWQVPASLPKIAL